MLEKPIILFLYFPLRSEPGFKTDAKENPDMATGDETTDASTDPAAELGTNTNPDPDLDTTYEEAYESERFRYAEIYSREDAPSDKDSGQLRLDYNDPDATHTMLIRPGEGDDDEDHVVIKTDAVWRTIFPGSDPTLN